MKRLYYFVLAILLEYSQQITQQDCLGKNKKSGPMFNGKFCYDQQSNECKFIDSLTLNDIEENQNLVCGTGVEECMGRTPENINDRDRCYYLTTEHPYKCCFVRIKTKTLCYPVDVSKKRNWKILEYNFRAYFGIEDPAKTVIDCSGKFIKSIIALGLMVVLF